MRGSLPWQGIKINRKDDKFKKICDVKKYTTSENLCRGSPGNKFIFFYFLIEEFAKYMEYAKNLQFEASPDYDYLRGLFRKVMEKNNIVNDLKFDWVCDKKTQEKEEQKVIFAIEGQKFHQIVFIFFVKYIRIYKMKILLHLKI